MNDVRRGTRELLARIRLERITRADNASQVSLVPVVPDEPTPSEGLMPDPTITRISEKLIAQGLADRPREPAAVEPVAAAAAPSGEPVAGEAPAARSDRITRQYASTKLGISPLHPEDATLTLDLSAARPATPAAASQQRFAKMVGLQPFAAAQRRDLAPAIEPARATMPTPEQGAVDRAMPKIDSVPTLGPGLIWRLSQAGIVTMADLAASDAATIRAKLGQVGRLVKVEDWIAHARAVMSGEAPDATMAGHSLRRPALVLGVCFGRIGEGGAAALTDASLGAAAATVCVAVMVRDGWFVALIEGAPHPVTKLLGKLIIDPQLSETTLCAWEALRTDRAGTKGVKAVIADDDAGFDPRGQTAADLIALVRRALLEA